MKKLILAGTGVLLLAIAIFLNIHIRNAEKLATARNDTEHKFGSISGEMPPCSWHVRPPDKVMSENKSQAIMIETKNSAQKKCITYLSLRAPGFDMNPHKEEQEVSLPAGGKGSISWIVTPNKMGTYDVAISDVIDTKIFGITVTNTFGLTTTQAKLFSTLSGLFGPMLTVPWWFDRLKQRKKSENKKELEQEKKPE